MIGSVFVNFLFFWCVARVSSDAADDEIELQSMLKKSQVGNCLHTVDHSIAVSYGCVV